MIAYQTAYLKSNFPMEFFCALMNCDINNFDKLNIYCNEVRKLGFKIQKPDINTSDVNFVVNYDQDKNPLGIEFWSCAIKKYWRTFNSGTVKEKKRNGSYKNLDDLLKRISNSVLNKKVLEALIFQIH